MICAQGGEVMDLLQALGTFVRVAETGSFSAVGRESGASHSAVTRLIGQLETHFGVRLFHRTTRRLSLTEDGQDLLSQARHLLEVAEDLEGTLGRNRLSPTGLVRIGVSVGGAMMLVPRLRLLFTRYPGLSVELVVRDRFGDMIDERLDVALQLGQPADASLVTRAVATFGHVTVASPAYLEKHGAPASPADLAAHACIIHETRPDSAVWHFTGSQGPVTVNVAGLLRVNNSEVARHAALAGYGIAQLPEQMVLDDIRAARLYRLLKDYPSQRQQGFVVYPSRRHLPLRTRVVIDYLVEQVKLVEARLAEARELGETETAWLV
jgi:DNA-binding transcriptional LysR family regulator